MGPFPALLFLAQKGDIMDLHGKHFRLQNDIEKERPDTFTVKLNKQEREEFNWAKLWLQQSKDSTALKQLAWLSIKKVLLDPSMSALRDTLFKNERNNVRLGVKPDVEISNKSVTQPEAKVTQL